MGDYGGACGELGGLRGARGTMREPEGAGGSKFGSPEYCNAYLSVTFIRDIKVNGTSKVKVI